MREVQASDVARGETIIIARQGRSIARIVPEARASEVIRRGSQAYDGSRCAIHSSVRGADGWPRLARRCEDPLS